MVKTLEAAWLAWAGALGWFTAATLAPPGRPRTVFLAFALASLIWGAYRGGLRASVKTFPNGVALSLYLRRSDG